MSVANDYERLVHAVSVAEPGYYTRTKLAAAMVVQFGGNRKRWAQRCAVLCRYGALDLRPRPDGSRSSQRLWMGTRTIEAALRSEAVAQGDARYRAGAVGVATPETPTPAPPRRINVRINVHTGKPIPTEPPGITRANDAAAPPIPDDEWWSLPLAVRIHLDYPRAQRDARRMGTTRGWPGQRSGGHRGDVFEEYLAAHPEVGR